MSLRSHGRHGRANAERAGLIAGGRDDAAFRGASHCNRLSAQVRIIALFHGRIESIHVDMDDLADGRGIAGHGVGFAHGQMIQLRDEKREVTCDSQRNLTLVSGKHDPAI
ncbi:hypothetical protein ACVWWR_003490 [Bradyrhizobium sp. LM3.2]